MKIAVIIINWNGKENTLHCLHSLSKESYTNKHIIVVDNGSTDGSVYAIKKSYPEVILLAETKNIGFAAGNNKGIEKALQLGCDAVFLLNNDTTVDEKCISSFLRTAKEYPRTILGAKIYQMYNPTYLDHLGGNWNNNTGNFDLIGKNELGITNYLTPISMDYACGCAMFIPSSVVKRVGMLNPDYFVYWEDSDFCFRARRLGYPTRLCPFAKVWHIGSSSMNSYSIQTIYFWWRNRLLWIDRNLSYRDKKNLWKKCIYREIVQTYKLYFLHWTQWKIYRQHQSKNSLYSKRHKRLLHYSNACRGIYHYVLGKF